MSASAPEIGKLSGTYSGHPTPSYGSRLRELTPSFVALLQHYISEVIFSCGRVGIGHWSRFHRFFSHAAWDLDTFSMFLAKLVATILAPGATLLWAVDDTLCRKRGLTLYGAGMHYDPLISSRAKSLVSWGHDWVVLCLILVHPFWAPTKVFALPIAFRLYKNRQGLTKGKKTAKKGKKGKKGKKPAKTGQKPAKKASQPKPKPDPNHRTRPELALELIPLAARWFPNDEIMVTGDSAYGGASILRHLPSNVHLISPVHPQGALYQPAPPKAAKTKGPARKKGDRLPGMAAWAEDPKQPWTELKFDQFGSHAIECTFENSKQLLGLEDPANRLPKAVERTAPMALIVYSLVVVWFHQTGHKSVRFPIRPWYPKKEGPSFADLLTTLRRVSYEEKTERLLPNRCGLKTWIAQVTELLSRAG